ncbi:Zeaxanthin epoxidase, chloroplastic [Cytospora mali]|uniref:Zeaxanthin epoxidase, chloroplastic n=1 Tax=Cytospora mali TaxID=578113 RepID=A0A194UR79_CYTMA|nr:Zeaxanthin epoxidase, chloroplastic [Valsa mali var. pyri (nom. inval.)]
MAFFNDVTASLNFNKVSEIPRHPLTGINVLIVGAGPAGLYSALECWRKGHSPRVVERAPSPSSAGDSFSITPSALRHIEKTWPAIYQDIDNSGYDVWISFHKINGDKVAGPERFVFDKDGEDRLTEDGEPAPDRIHRVARPRFTATLLGQALALGIEVTYGKRAVDYFEDGDKAGVICEDGSRLEADVVVAADGVGTKSHKLISGHDIRAVGSNYSIFRTAYSSELVTADTELAKRFPVREGAGVGEMWTTDDLQIYVGHSPGRIEWGMTHRIKDIAGTSKESWGNHVSPDYVVKYLKDNFPEVPEYLHRLIMTAPKNAIVDWQLLWRDPQPRWTSPLGRVVQVGDSAHTLVPSSGSGLVQGIEDAITLATCLQLGGNLKNGLWSRTHNKLRFERVSCCQLLGFINQSNYLKPEWGQKVIEDASNVKPQYGWWIWGHNPERYAYDNFGKAFRSLVDDTQFENTNIPRGYKYKPWSIKDIYDTLERGEKLKFEGDWS